MPSKSYPINEARAELSSLFDDALKGEPQRITRYGKEAVVVVSEKLWLQYTSKTPTLGHLLTSAARAGVLGEEVVTDRPWRERRLGADVD